jgi:group I intron endonuclease
MPSINITKEELLELGAKYKTRTKIAELYNCCIETISELIRKYNIEEEFNKFYKNYDEKAIIDYYLETKNLTKTAQTFDISCKLLNKFIDKYEKENNISIKPQRYNIEIIKDYLEKSSFDLNEASKLSNIDIDIFKRLIRDNNLDIDLTKYGKQKIIITHSLEEVQEAYNKYKTIRKTAEALNYPLNTLNQFMQDNNLNFPRKTTINKDDILKSLENNSNWKDSAKSLNLSERSFAYRCNKLNIKYTDSEPLPEIFIPEQSKDAYGIIYLAKNEINGLLYIGQTTEELKHRISGHRNDAYSKDDDRKGYFQNAIAKYGIENFSWKILQEYSNKDELNEAEIKWIADLNTRDRNVGYNVCPGGESGPVGIKHTTETIEKIRKSQLGKIISEETKKRMSKARKGVVYKHTYNVYKSIVEGKGGKIISPESDFLGPNEKLTFECKRKHTWLMEPVRLLDGRWCKECAIINNRLYSINEDFFSSDTEESFYIAGLFLARGIFGDYNLEIYIPKSMENYLNNIKNILNYTDVINIKEKSTIYLSICNKNFLSNLARFGLSNKGKFIPDWIKSHNLTNHLIRGYFDLKAKFYQVRLKGKDPFAYCELFGDEDILKQIHDLLKINNIVENYQFDENKLIYSGKEVEVLYSYIYNNSTLYLEQQKNDADKVCIINIKTKQKPITPNFKDITAEDLLNMADYYSDQKSIAKELNCASIKISNLIRRFNIVDQFKDKIRGFTDEDIYNAYKDKKSISYVLKCFSVGQNSIKEIIKKYSK